MVRCFAAVLAVVVCPLLAAQVEIAEPAFVPAGVTAVAGDAAQFYAFSNHDLTRVDRDVRTSDFDAIPLPGVYGIGRLAASGAGAVVVSAGDDLVGLTPDGTVLWRRNPGDGRRIEKILFDGGAFVVLWREPGSEPAIGISRIDAGGTILDTRTLLRGEQTNVADVDMALLGGDVLLAWRANYRVFVMRASDAATLDLAAQNVPAIALASNGQIALLTMAGYSGISGVFIGGGPEVIDGPFPISPAYARTHSVVWDGRAFRVAWGTESRDSVVTGLVSVLRGIHSVATVKFDTQGSGCRLIAGAGGALLECGSMGVFAEAGEPFDARAEPRALRYGRAYDSEPSVAWTGDRYGVVWNRQRSGLLARFFDRAGAPLGASFAVRQGTGGASPLAVASGDTLLVIWREYGSVTRVFARRFDLDGQPVDAAPFALGTGQVSAASDGRDFLIATTAGCSLTLFDLHARDPFRADAGLVLEICDTAVGLVQGLGTIALAFDGDEYGLLFNVDEHPGCTCNEPLPHSYPYLMKVLPSGVSRRAIPLLDPGDRPSAGVALVAGGGSYFVPWWNGAVMVSYRLGRKHEIADLPSGRSPTFWNGAAFVTLGQYEYVLHDSDGKRIAAHPFSHLKAGAGDGTGGMMLVHEDSERSGPLLATFRPAGEHRRAVRK